MEPKQKADEVRKAIESTPETASAEFVARNLIDLQKLADRARELRRRYIAEQVERMEKAIGLLQAYAALYEKLAVVNGATIATSLTLVGFLLSHSSGHLPKGPFEWLVGPAWVLLLVSTYCCWQQINRFHNMNASVFSLIANQQRGLFYTEAAECISEFASLVKPENAGAEEVAAAMNAIRKILKDFCAPGEGDAFEQEYRKLQKIGTTVAWAHSALICTLIAVLLLCTFAIRTLITA